MLKAHRGPVAELLPRILEFMAGRIDQSPIAAVAKLVISESRAFPEIGRFYLKEVIGRGLPLLEGLIVRGMEQGEFRKVDPAMTVRSIVGAMLLAGIWRTVFEPIHADLMLHALKSDPLGTS
jgi:hypothetical protein